MKRLTIGFVFAAAALAADVPQTYTGLITDTMCGTKHGMMKGQPDSECVKMCVKGSRDYALYDGSTVWKLSDQKTPARFAGQKVKVMGLGNLQTKTIKVTSVEALP